MKKSWLCVTFNGSAPSEHATEEDAVRAARASVMSGSRALVARVTKRVDVTVVVEDVAEEGR